MQAIYFFTDPDLQPEFSELTRSRPRLDFNVADGTVLTHLIGHLYASKPTSATIILPESLRPFVEQKIQTTMPDVAIELRGYGAGSGHSSAIQTLQVSVEAATPDESIWLCDDSAIVLADYDSLEAGRARAAHIKQSCLWVREPSRLQEALSRLTDNDSAHRPLRLNELIESLDVPVQELTADKYLPISTPDQLLVANRRLLALGYATSDALERSYAEEFGVIPPVFIHPSAEIIGSVIGPYATIGANCVIEDCIVKDSIVQPAGEVNGCVLEKSIIGSHSSITAAPLNLRIGDSQKHHLKTALDSQ